jgi:hypothetical protein
MLLNINMRTARLFTARLTGDRFNYIHLFIIRSKTVDKKVGYIVGMFLLTVLGDPTIFLTETGIEILSTSIGNKFE